VTCHELADRLGEAHLELRGERPGVRGDDGDLEAAGALLREGAVGGDEDVVDGAARQGTTLVSAPRASSSGARQYAW
jgi:hypothetical protein